MLHVLNAFTLFVSANLLIAIYFPCDVISASLMEIVSFRADHPLKIKVEQSLTMAGECFADGVKQACCRVGLDGCVIELIKWLGVTYQVFFGLVLLGSVFAMLFTHIAERQRCSMCLMREMRCFTIAVQVIASMAGFAACVAFIPLMRQKLTTRPGALVDAIPGWGFFLTFVIAIAVGLQTVGFSNFSEDVLKNHRPSGVLLVLDDAAEVEEAQSLLLEKSTV